MEFGFKPAATRFEQVRYLESRHVEIALTCSNLVAGRFAAGLSQTPLRDPGRRQVLGWSQTCHRPASSC